MSKDNRVCAGIDTSKRKLDVALEGRSDQLQVDNTPDGHRALSAWLGRHRVERIGIEASAGIPNTEFAAKSSGPSNAPGAAAPEDIHSAGLTAQIAAVRAAPSRPPRSKAPYPPIDQPKNATREVSRPWPPSIGISSFSTMAPASSPEARLCQ